MRILAIETSCDDTSIALIEARGKKRVSFNILSNIVSSQIEIHKKWGGVYPTLAKREHQKNLIPVLKKALRKAKELKTSNRKFQITSLQSKILKKTLEREPELLNSFLKTIPRIKKPRIEAIAVTIGPGLDPCLWVGVNFAKALAYLWKLPIIPVNHIEAHIYANCLKPDFKQFAFPVICLIVSGGHTQLVLMKDHGKYKILGETRDDAAGECLDKTARILGLGYPGGPIIAKMAAKIKDQKQLSKKKIKNIELPRPMIYSKDYDFSFSGLKTAVLYNFKKQTPKIRKSKNYICQMCFESQQAIIDVLIRKTIKAAKAQQAKTIILGGGVTANQELRKQMKKAIKKFLPDTILQIPDFQYCTDNAAMVAATSCFHYLKGKRKKWKEIKAESNLRLNG